jgi:hypothetical protein
MGGWLKKNLKFIRNGASIVTFLHYILGVSRGDRQPKTPTFVGSKAGVGIELIVDRAADCGPNRSRI